MHSEVCAEQDVTPMGGTVRPANPRGSMSPSPLKALAQEEQCQSQECGRAPTFAAVFRLYSRRCRRAWGAALPGAAGAAAPRQELLLRSCHYFKNKEGAGAVATCGRGCSQHSTSRFLTAAHVVFPGISDAKLTFKLPYRDACILFFSSLRWEPSGALTFRI